MSWVIAPDYRYDSLPLFLVDFGCLVHGDYTLRGGDKDEVYADLRGLSGHPRSLAFVARHLVDAARPMFPHGPGFVAASGAAIPLATLVAQGLEVPFAWVRDVAKDHGTSRLVEGYYERQGAGLIIDDVLTTGSSIEDTKAKLDEVGLIATKALVVVDRRPSQSRGRVAGLITRSLTTLPALLKIEKEHITRHNGKYIIRDGEIRRHN